ncbi:MAG: aldo/keto reductase [Anaerolineae bacterium]|nr:aldo/keto reductase [Anaerolineae bacterium]NUQ06664.1 aldo/keto reductase [Anaerolineae bacterium]
MRYKLLGKSGLRVSELCLGTMTFGETWGWGASLDESEKIFRRFSEAGGNFIDTSCNYTEGTSETFLGEFLGANRDSFVVATKYTLTKTTSTDPNSGGNSRKNMMRSVESSLRRLRTDYLDILYLHVWDYMTPVDEVLRGLDDLVRQGKTAYIAVSDTPAYIVAQANMLAELRGWANFIGMQAPYSLNRREIERELLPMAKHWGMGVMPWGVIGGGVLTGKYDETDDESPKRYDPARMTVRERTRAIIDAVKAVSEETGRSRAQVAINWVRQQQQQAQIVPIIGARTVAQMEDNLGVLAWTLTDAQLQRLSEASAIDLGFPHDFTPGNPYIYGATYDLIDKRP